MATASSEACRNKVSILFEIVQISATKFIQHRNVYQISSLATEIVPFLQQSPKTKLSVFGLYSPVGWGICTRECSEMDPNQWVPSLKLATSIALAVRIAVGALVPPEV